MNHPKEYAQSTALSQSDLKLFEMNIKQFHEQKILGKAKSFKYTRSMEIGDIADVLLTDPEHFDDIYFVYSNNRVSETLKKVADTVMDLITQRIEEGIFTKQQFLTNPITAYAEEFFHSARYVEVENQTKKSETSIGYKNNYGEDALKAELMDKCQAYFEDLKLAYGKTMINIRDYQLAKEVNDRIKANEFTKRILAPLLFPELHPEHEVKLQLMLFGEVNETLIKGLLDITIINHLAKEIIYIDLKISNTPDQFRESYRKFKYYRQGSFYRSLLAQAFPDYNILPPFFIVGFTNLDYQPEVFQMSLNEIHVGASGGEFKSGQKVTGYEELLYQINWHYKHNLWEHSMKYYLEHKNKIDNFK